MRDRRKRPEGKARKVIVTPDGKLFGRWKPNLVLNSWATIVSNLLLNGDRTYRINGMYIEYENVADPDDVVSPPDYGRGPEAGLPYYLTLGASADRDYLRVPIRAATIDVDDEVNFPDGNILTFFAQTSGLVGVNGKPFSDAANSKVFGAALVAIRDQADSSRDVVFSRVYLDADEQQVKLPTSQTGIEWQIDLE